MPGSASEAAVSMLSVMVPVSPRCAPIASPGKMYLSTARVIRGALQCGIKRCCGKLAAGRADRQVLDAAAAGWRLVSGWHAAAC